ncbi:transcriptional regulator, LysR family protein [alpha proteobacterium BAL199]|nr:transcriptional regulator, LysR family protein [alpha proteobacterium BAL199]
MNWDDLRTALAIRQGGTLSAAARSLAVNQTTAARRLERLERDLGARLFDRIDGRLVPTDAGRSALERAEDMEAAAVAVVGDVRNADSGLAGPVRITSLPSFVTGFLAPRLPEFTERHPGITVELVGASENLHLGRREADLAVRFSRPTAGNVRVHRIGVVGYAGYAAASAVPDTDFRSLKDLPWAAYDERFAHLPEQRWLDEQVRPTRRAATATDGLALLALARSRTAAAVLPCFLADGVDGLVRITGSEPICRRELWLLSHPDLRAVRRISVFADWLRQVVDHERTRLDGRIEAPEG